jgi:hypothetical protein
MGIKIPLPPNISRKIVDPADRKAIGKAAETPEQSNDKFAGKLEREEQKQFAGLLRLAMERGELIFDWSRTDRRTTNITGRADFWIAANNRFLQIEFKAATGRLSREQVVMKHCSEASGTDYNIVFRATEAFELLKQWLEEI